ncbi:MAG: hypothetical protein U1E15_09055 [Hyphomicrobiales bacterium]
MGTGPPGSSATTPRPDPHLAPPAPRLPPHEAPLIGHQLEELRRVILNFAFLCIVGLLAYTAVRLLSENNAVVEPLGLPKAIKELGYSEDAAALTMTSAMRNIKERAQSGDGLIIVKARAEEQDIEVPVGEVNVTSFIRLLRQVIGLPQKRIAVISSAQPMSAPPSRWNCACRMDSINAPVLLKPIAGTSPDDPVPEGRRGHPA